MKSFAKFGSLIILTFLMLLVCSSVYATAPENAKAELLTFVHAHYSAVSQSPVSTGILYDLTLPLSHIERFGGAESSRAASGDEWRQIAFELRNASLTETDLPTDQALHETGRGDSRDHVYHLAFLNYRYNRVRDGVPVDSAIQRNENGVTAIDGNLISEQRVFAVSALHGRTYRGEETHFRVDLDQFYFSNDPHPLKRLEIDFDDGAGYRTISRVADVTVHYSVPGLKTIRARAELSSGPRVFAAAQFDVVVLTTPNPTQTWNLTAAIPFDGQAATGQAYVYLGAGNDSLTRPILVSEGFDFFNDMYWDEFYALMNQQNLIETMHELGYDVIILNYTDATTYVERNALLMETLIDTVQSVINPSRTLVVVGPSMGGLCTRYALAYMESNNIPHRVRTWISFDSPQRGANIPLGLQYWVDFFASQSSSAATLRDALNSPGAREMLLTHFTSPPSNTAGSDPLRATMLNEFTLVGGYPQLLRKVSIANGSGTGQNSGFNPGAQLIRYEYSDLFVGLTGDVWALNNTASQRIFNGQIRILFSTQNESVTVQPTWPWDNAPGGLRNSMYQLDTTAAPYGDIVALHDNHCFIPTISSLDLNVQDPFFDIAHAPNLHALSPFDSLYYPAENQDHVTITPQNVWWFLQEAIDSLPAPQIVVSADSNAVRLLWSRVPGAQSYHVYASEIWDNWPSPFAATTDTLWTDPNASPLLKFYKVVASTSPAP